MCGRLNREGGLFEILAQRGGAYQKGDLIKKGGFIELLQ